MATAEQQGPLIRHGERVVDPWIGIADDEQHLLYGPIIVSLARWRAEREKLIATGQPLGIRLASHHTAGDIAADLEHLNLVAVEFPAIADGRGYTVGRMLRERYGFRGEIRAVGPLVRDVFAFLVRSGFDAVEARDETEAEAWDEAVGAITVTYQPQPGFGASSGGAGK